MFLVIKESKSNYKRLFFLLVGQSIYEVYADSPSLFALQKF